MLETTFETPKMSSNPDEILAAVMVMADELRALLLRDKIFRTVRVEGPSNRRNLLMSCGGLLARLHRLHQQRAQLTARQQLVLTTAQARVDETMLDLHDVFHSMLQREAKSRLVNLAEFLDDGIVDRAYLYDEYAVEMRNRQRLEEIIKTLGDDLAPELSQELTRLDARIRELCRPTSFIWEAELAPVYPAAQYWYLYLEPIVE